MRILPFATILLASAALGACATTYKPPIISYDDTPRKAVLTPDPPRPVRIVELPRDIVEIEPAWRGYDYFMVGDRFVIVDPVTLEIVAILLV